MTREIKFRAWTGELMVDLYKVTPFALTEGMGDGLFLPFDKKYLLMQFTGLLDKNGTEIYEGDIVDTTHNYAGVERGFVVYCAEMGRWAGFCHRRPAGDFDLASMTKEMEIIGNIHENPELLK